MKKTLSLIAVCCSILILNSSCASTQTRAGSIAIPKATAQQKRVFNRDALSTLTSLEKPTGQSVSGFRTDNQFFLREVIDPILAPQVPRLKQLPPIEAVNELALFGYEIFRQYFGEPEHRWEFYRWGGDFFDLDDPQEKGVRHDRRFGLDCSGFVAMPYELAVHYGLLKEDDPAAVFSSQGFAHYCQKNFGVADKGGRGGGPNRYRVDSSDMANLGREIFSVPKNGTPTVENLKRLQAGDVVSGPGHVGLIVEVQGHLYYLESGVTVVGSRGERMVTASEALRLFAKDYPLTIRRALPDYGLIAR